MYQAIEKKEHLHTYFGDVAWVNYSYHIWVVADHLPAESEQILKVKP